MVRYFLSTVFKGERFGNLFFFKKSSFQRARPLVGVLGGEAPLLSFLDSEWLKNSGCDTLKISRWNGATDERT